MVVRGRGKIVLRRMTVWTTVQSSPDLASGARLPASMSRMLLDVQLPPIPPGGSVLEGSSSPRHPWLSLRGTLRQQPGQSLH